VGIKSDRQKLILDVIERQEIETQNQLIDALRASGMESTQATLSRDIKELRLVKELTPGGTYKYARDVKGTRSPYSERLSTIFRECVTSFTSAQNIVVIKTLPGLASAACSAIDGMDLPEIAGSLAGDDTAFIAMRDNAAAESLCRDMEKLL
jgi:transcriptional regulator of arginine metabolism